MPATRRQTLADACTALGHALVLTGFLLPWVGGSFGARDAFSGLDLARLPGGLIAAGIGHQAITSPIAHVALPGVPVLAADGLLLLAIARLGLLSRRTACRAAFVLAAPIALAALLVLVLVIGAARRGDMVAGPGVGLYLAAAGAGIALLSGGIDRTHGRTPVTTSLAATRPGEA